PNTTASLHDALPISNNAEIVLAETEDGAIVDHAAMLVAERRVNHLALAQLADVTGGSELQQGLGVRTCHLELAEGTEIHDHRLLDRKSTRLNSSHVQ